jgi:hypothetical protein
MKRGQRGARRNSPEEQVERVGVAGTMDTAEEAVVGGEEQRRRSC